MISSRSRQTIDIWPGFVDALATLLIIIIFVLMVFVLGQFFLANALSGRDKALDILTIQLNEIGEMLSLERENNKKLALDLSALSDQLISANTQLDQMTAIKMENKDLLSQINLLNLELDSKENTINRYQSTIESASLAAKADKEKIDTQIEELALLQQRISGLEILKNEFEAKVNNLEKILTQRESIISEERRKSIEAQAQTALMSQQLVILQRELSRLAETLDASDAISAEQKAQISDLGRRMNRALATKVQELQRYRSEFFGRLRDILGTRPGIRIVGDRFVFQSEVLFQSGSAELEMEGRTQLKRVANTLLQISKDIPQEVDWILRIDGHTDNLPISTNEFPSNWELSTARALSVLNFIIDQGIPPNRLAATGFGQYQPIDNSNSITGRSRNRRIELKFDQR